MRLDHRSPLFNFLLGTAAGAVLATVPLVEHFTHQAERHAEEIGQSIQRLNERLSAAQLEYTELERRATESDLRAAACETASRAQAQELGARDFRDSWYTLVYEPGAATDNAPPLELLNFVRPGLGTMLARVQAQQPAGMQHLRYVLRGFVEPALPPTDGVHFVRTLDPSIATQKGVQ